MAGALGISKADIAGAWPVFLTGSSSRILSWHVPLLESDLETQPSLLCAAQVGARKGKGEGPALHSQLVEVNEGKKNF